MSELQHVTWPAAFMVVGVVWIIPACVWAFFYALSRPSSSLDIVSNAINSAAPSLYSQTTKTVAKEPK